MFDTSEDEHVLGVEELKHARALLASFDRSGGGNEWLRALGRSVSADVHRIAAAVLNGVYEGLPRSDPDRSVLWQWARNFEEVAKDIRESGEGSTG